MTGLCVYLAHGKGDLLSSGVPVVAAIARDTGGGIVE